MEIYQMFRSQYSNGQIIPDLEPGEASVDLYGGGQLRYAVPDDPISRAQFEWKYQNMVNRGFRKSLNLVLTGHYPKYKERDLIG